MGRVERIRRNDDLGGEIIESTGVKKPFFQRLGEKIKKRKIKKIYSENGDLGENPGPNVPGVVRETTVFQQIRKTAEDHKKEIIVATSLAAIGIGYKLFWVKGKDHNLPDTDQEK